MASNKLDAIVLAEMRKRSPYAQCQYVDVTFNSTANADTDIRHDLTVTNPYDVNWQVVQWMFSADPATAPVIYRDTSSDRKAWGSGYIVLRCNVASVVVRLLLSVER